MDSKDLSAIIHCIYDVYYSFSSHIFNDSAIQKNIFVTLIAVCFLGGVVLNFGVCLKSNFTQWAWHRFYQHSPPDTMQKTYQSLEYVQ